VPEARQLQTLGYDLVATEGTYRTLVANGIRVERVNKVHEGRPHIVDLIKNREIQLVLNTPAGRQQREDDSAIRAAAISAGIPVVTTAAGISAVVMALDTMHRREVEVEPLQAHHARIVRPGALASPRN
jgi:carbamoyl-phosphate synthase large subunit